MSATIPSSAGVCPARQEKSLLFRTGRRSLPSRGPRPLHVAGIDPAVRVQFAARRDEWLQAFRLVARAYQTRGYDRTADGEFHFTPFHALPGTAVLVAKEHEPRHHRHHVRGAGQHLAGTPTRDRLPRRSPAFRQAGRRLCEVSSLGDVGLNPREFTAVFVDDTVGLAFHCRLRRRHGGDHRSSKARVLLHQGDGLHSLRRPEGTAASDGFPVEAFAGDTQLLRANAPAMYRLIFERPLPGTRLSVPPMPDEFKLEFAARSCRTNPQVVEGILRRVHRRRTASGAGRLVAVKARLLVVPPRPGHAERPEYDGFDFGHREQHVQSELDRQRSLNPSSGTGTTLTLPNNSTQAITVTFSFSGSGVKWTNTGASGPMSITFSSELPLPTLLVGHRHYSNGT